MTSLSKYTLAEKGLLASSFLMPFVLVIRDQLIPPFILLFFLTTIPLWKSGKRLTNLVLPITLGIFYLLHVISIFYSEDWNYGGQDLMTKLSYLLFPLFAILLKGGRKLVYNGIVWGLIIASGISMIFSLVRAIVLEGGLSGTAFQSNHYGLNMHASYLALLFIFSGVFLWNQKLKGKTGLLIKMAYTGLIVISVFYLRSLGAFICIALILMILPVWKAIQDRNWKWYLLLPCYAVLFLLGIYLSPKISNDFQTSLSKVGTYYQSPEQFLLDNKNNTESNTVRLVTWTLSSRILRDYPFGGGIGDVKIILEKYYRSYGYTYYVHYKLNPHNQYLQTGIAVGWPGVLILLFIFYRMLALSFRKKHLPLFILAACFFVSCLFESMLERQVGVIAFSMTLMLTSFLSSDTFVSNQSTKIENNDQ